MAQSYTAPVLALLLLGAMAGSIYLAPDLSAALDEHFATLAQVERLRSLTLGLGSALVGASAIAFALVMFAMQVNVERMPYGLFRKLSSDRRLLTAFLATFSLSIAVAFLSLAPEQDSAIWMLLGALWGAILVLILLLYAYRRALYLINPLEQLNLIAESCDRDFRVWKRRARRAAPFLETKEDNDSGDAGSSRSDHDTARVAFFALNPYWTSTIKRSIAQATSYSRRYAEQGDYDVSGAALAAIVKIHQSYIEAKGKTFFSNALLFQNPLTTDGLINETLEDLRKNVRLGLSRGDEQQVEQSLSTIATLARIYMAIDYASDYAEKTHAHLAAGYLQSEVESVLPHNMPDVLMEGVRLMGSTARAFLTQGDPTDSVSLIDKIGLISCAGAGNEKYQPVTLTGMEQLSAIALDLLKTRNRNIGFAIKDLHNNVSMVAKMFLMAPDTPIASRHSMYLGPYFSLITPGGFLQGLTNIVNWLVTVEESDDDARTVLSNVSDWADGVHRPIKEVLLEAIDKKSGLAFDIIHWIASVFELLLAASNSPACDDRIADDIRRHASWLVSVISWIPDTKDSVAFVENVRLTEILFKAALVARTRSSDQLFEDVRELLLQWTIKGGKHNTGWGTLKHSIYGLCALALIDDEASQATKIKADISNAIAQDGGPEQELLDRTAMELRRKAATLYRDGHWSSDIEMALARVDQDKLKGLLEEIANIISPGTAGAIVDSGAI